MLLKLPPQLIPRERFQADLAAICGSFGVECADGRRDVLGRIQLETRSGIDMAHVAKDVRVVRRTEQDIRRDAGENFFLIVQEEGHAFMQQNGTTRMMKPGDMMLIDSAAPSEFTFFGNYSRQLSLHLPRVEMHERFGNAAVGGHYVQQTDYHAIALGAILSKVFSAGTNAPQTTYLKEAIYGVLGAVLHERADDTARSKIDAEVTRAQALERGIAYIDRCITDCTLSAQTVADAVGISIRQLQRAFALAGTTPTDYLLKKRFEKACQMLSDRQKDGDPMLVSSIAYACGFNDISYFNRQFRRFFGCAPGQFAPRAD